MGDPAPAASWTEAANHLITTLTRPALAGLAAARVARRAPAPKLRSCKTHSADGQVPKLKHSQIRSCSVPCPAERQQYDLPCPCRSRCCLVQHAKMQISCAPDAGSALHAQLQRHGEKPRALWPPCFCIANKTDLRWAHQLLLVQLYKLQENRNQRKLSRSPRNVLRKHDEGAADQILGSVMALMCSVSNHLYQRNCCRACLCGSRE
jgi:hypothetical protein